MISDVRIRDIKSIPDERGFFSEIFRGDWLDFIEGDKIMQANLSMSFPGMVRAWHRHDRGQVDYFVVLKGKVKICVYQEPSNKRNGQLLEIVLSGDKPQIVRVPGKYWHGTKCISDEPSLLVYFVTKLYDYTNPDENRMDWRDKSVINPKTGKPYVW
jgi:dTDP-4-dehydrorhamnose 3,5-epimerase